MGGGGGGVEGWGGGGGGASPLDEILAEDSHGALHISVLHGPDKSLLCYFMLYIRLGARGRSRNFKRGGGGVRRNFLLKRGGGGVQPLTREQFVLQMTKIFSKKRGVRTPTPPPPPWICPWVQISALLLHVVCLGALHISVLVLANLCYSMLHVHASSGLPHNAIVFMHWHKVSHGYLNYGIDRQTYCYQFLCHQLCCMGV